MEEEGIKEELTEEDMEEEGNEEITEQDMKEELRIIFSEACDPIEVNIKSYF